MYSVDKLETLTFRWMAAAVALCGWLKKDFLKGESF